MSTTQVFPIELLNKCLCPYLPNFIPAGSVLVDQASEEGDYTVKGFYDPITEELHIQEVIPNHVK